MVSYSAPSPTAPSPTASTNSGTTTNPNTPRPEHDQEHPADVGQADVSSPQPVQDESSSGEDGEIVEGNSSSSDASRQRAHDIQPTWPRKVETKTPALAFWHPSHRLDNIFLDMNWAPRDTSGSVFFKLRTSLRFEGGPSVRRDGHTSVYIFIHPERVRHLSFNTQPDRKPFGPNTVALDFGMSRAPALVLPSAYDYLGPEAEEVMKSLRELATQLSFTIYTSLPRRTLPISWLQQLCTAVTDQKLSPILACANLRRLYRGQGAQLLEGDNLSEPFPDPPAYEDVGPRPPHAAQGETKGKKRRRSSSSESASESASKPMNRAAVEALLDSRLATHKREVGEMLAVHKSQISQLLSDFKTELDDKLDTREERLVVDRLTDLVAEKVQEEMEEVQERLLLMVARTTTQIVVTMEESHNTATPTRTPREVESVVRQSEDKLRNWQRILDRSTLFRARDVEVGPFFNLALELMDGDLGASQETIRKLATDAGLEFIKAVTDRNILEAVDLQSRINLWRSQIGPLCRLVTHSRAVDSNVLEQEVTKIHSFLLGVNASRADRLFGFIVSLVKAWPNNTSDDDPLAAVLEVSLAVLFRLVDCNTTNIVNDSFHRLVEQFETLLNSSKHSGGEFSRLQATKYLEYLQRRLGVGKGMSDVKTHQVAAVRPEDFVVHLDLAGHLSKDGPRHDNDHADIANIRIMPTYQEITTPRNEYLPTTDSSQWHLPGIRGRLDREFRLLREDTVGQLRDAVSDMFERLRNPGRQGHRQSQNSARISTYADATIQELKLNKDRGLELTVRCRQPEMARKMNRKERRLWWDQGKRLQPGALTCVIDVAGMVQFFVVADSTLRVEKSPEEHASYGSFADRMNLKEDAADRRLEQLTLSSDVDHLYVKLHLVNNSGADTGRVLRWFREVGSFPSRHLVEFPGVLLASFQYTLEALQQLSKKPDLPFTDLIAPQGSSNGSEIAVSPPLFARAPGFKFNLQCLTKDQQPFSIGIGQLPTAEEVSTRTGLDYTQSEALLDTLCREFSLIQGPPGTGKSYTGEKILKVLLANKDKLNLGPVICVCYTNHALDQLLEHLLDDNIKNIIRMGSRSKSERLKNLNVRTVSENAPLTKTEKRQNYELGQRMRGLESEATILLDQLSRCKSLSAIRTYLAMSHPSHCRELFHDDDDEGWQKVQHSRLDVVQNWLAGATTVVPDNPGVSRPIEALESMKLAVMTHSERSKLHRFWLKEIRDTIIGDLNQTLKEHDETREQRHRVRQEVRRRCLQQADIVGVTTTGLARELPLLRKIRAKVMLCEEAGEVLEAHVLTAMLPSIEQAILIGDHLQLRPQIQNYQLQSTSPKGVQYSLDMSLFERLVQPPLQSDSKLPVTVLETQRRMHPSIAEMVRSTLYNKLNDATQVMEYPEVVGMRHRLFWLHHEALEAGAAVQDPHNTSHSNDYEVEMTACLVSHLVRQGEYSPEDIAVLTPYLGQLQKLSRRMAAESTFAVTLDDRDLDDLEELNMTQSDKPVPSKKQTVAKTTLARSVRLATVDNFQGEEAKVVIISLVRSNPQKRCGFLRTSNRINVLLSRAKHGCYIIGNATTYSDEYKEVDVDEAPCIFPDCGHFFTVESMDGQMSMREHYEMDENEMPTAIKNSADPFSMDEVKACSVCRSSLRNIARYGRIVRRAMLDEATKKFISWSAIRHLELAERLMTEQQKLEQNSDKEQDVGRPGRLDLIGDASTQIRNLGIWVGQKRYKGLAQTYVEISKFVEQVSVESQPFHRVFEFVRHAKRQNKTGAAFDYDQDIIQLRGYLLALSLLLKCSISFLSDFMSLRKASGINRTIITVDFASNFAQCEKLIKLATDTSRPQLQVEGHIYFAQLCGFSLCFAPSDDSADVSVPGAFPETTTTVTTTTGLEEGSKHENIKNDGLEHLDRARSLLKNAAWDSKRLMEAEIEAADNVLNGGVFYCPVTSDEMRAVYAAMAREFHGTGHWYTCEQGHPFTVGECGMPMEQARCPECGSAVGGQNHAPAEGVRHADAIEELARDLDGMRV
ncbi:hypothetical protein diail_11919 [Diaporthe ilicicola]|nr:hypothetical protein diail_11919 [Diaporthe ilicicola]